MVKRRRGRLNLETPGESYPMYPGPPVLEPGWTGWHAVSEGEEAETPHPRLRVHRGFRSRILPDRRDLIVYMPPGYDAHENRGRQYSVLYLNDGQNLFDGRTSFIKDRTWEAVSYTHLTLPTNREV